MKTTVTLKRPKRYQETQKAMAGIERALDAANYQAASIARDPIDALFDGVKFRNIENNEALRARVRAYCQHEAVMFDKRMASAYQELNAEKREFAFRCENLEQSIREIKRHQAEEIIDAIRRQGGTQVNGLVAADERKY